MNFFLDENFPKPAADVLISRGHQVFDIRSTEFEGSSDSTIFQLAQEKEAILPTTDKDFFHTIPFLFEEHCGIIVIALRQPNRESVLEKVVFVLDHFELTDLKSKVLHLKDKHYSLI